MAIRDFYSDVDLKANQLFNSRLHNITTAARVALGLGLTTSSKGYMVYDTDLKTPYFWDGTAWQSAGGGTWGSITGTITSQTDLINYLSTNYYPVTNPAGYLDQIAADLLYYPLSSNPAGYLTSASLPIPTLQQVTDQGNIVTDSGNTGSSQLSFDRYDIQEIGGSAIGMNVNIGGSPYLYVQSSAGGTVYYMNNGIAIGYNSMYFPALTTNRYLTLSVNGNYADLTGEITVPVGTGTVTSVAALTLGTSGTDLNSTVANGTTTPVITLNVPDASASARGVVNTTTQTFAGAKTFSSDLNVNGLTIGRGPGNGSDTTTLGFYAHSYLTSGTYNTAVGSGAGQGITTGSRNTAIGWAAIFDSPTKTGFGNTAVGWYAGRRLDGQYNTGIGYQVFGAGAGISTITGTYNTAVGTNAGLGISTGNYNTVVGAQTTIGNVSNNVILADGQGNVRFKDDNTNTILSRLAGSGTRMVVAGTNGELSTQTIPSGGILHGTASGTDTYTATIGTATSYTDGDAFLVRFTNGNTGTSTLNINGIGARDLYRNNDGAILGGDIVDGAEMLCIYDGTTTHFQVIGVAPNTLLGYVTNGESVAITKGQAVYAYSGTGDRMVVKLAYNTGDATSAQTVGLVLSSSIGANQKGLIMMQGLLDGLSILPTSTYNDGDPIYLGATAGAITKTKPYAPNHLVYLGVVTTASPGAAGRMYVRVQNGYELDELHNVQAQSPSLKDTLWYDNGVSPAQWKTASIPTILGYTPLQRSITTVASGTTAAGSAAGTDYVYIVSGTATITLPTAVGNTNRYTIKNTGTGIVSIGTTSSQTIDGSAGPITINTQYVSLDLISDNANWNII